MHNTSILILEFSIAHFCTEWTTEGCQTAELNGSVVTCYCNHITNFAVLVVSVVCVLPHFQVLHSICDLLYKFHTSATLSIGLEKNAITLR